MARRSHPRRRGVATGEDGGGAGERPPAASLARGGASTSRSDSCITTSIAGPGGVATQDLATARRRRRRSLFYDARTVAASAGGQRPQLRGGGGGEGFEQPVQAGKVGGHFVDHLIGREAVGGERHAALDEPLSRLLRHGVERRCDLELRDEAVEHVVDERV